MAPTAMIVWILCLILISVAFVRWQWSVQLFLIVGVLVFLVGALTGLTNEPLSVFGALVMGLTWLLLYHASGIRKKYLTRPVFDRMQKALQTDIRAVHGSKSDRMPGWEAALFNGHPDWGRLLATSRPELNDEERNFIGGPVEALCALMLDGSTHQDALCAQIQDFFRENEFFALTVPREYDGKGFSDHALSCITLRLSSSYWPLVVSTMTPHLHGLGRLLDHYGSDLQKYHYLPRIASGEEIPWLMLIEGLLDSSNTLQGGIVCKIRRQGVDKLGFRVNWTNQQILSNSEVTVIGLIFCTYDPDGILDDGQFPKVVCALVPIGTEGITTHPYQETQQPHRSGILVHGNDVLIPFDWILGNPAQVEQGDNLEQMETRLVEENQFLIALATGMTKAAARSCGALVRVYRQYSYGAGQSEDVQLALAQIGGLAYLLDCGRIQLNSTVAMQAEPGTISTFVRQQSLKWSQQVNFLSRNIYGRMLKRHDQSDHIDACSLQFDWNSAEVITELLSKDMSLFGQSVLHWHPSLADEVRICHEPNSDFGFTAFDETICHHLADALTSKVRMFVLGLSRGRLAQGTGDGLVRYFSRQVDYLSAALCWTVDNVIVMTAGNLNHHQLLCVRFSEAFGFLYLASAVIKRYRDNGQETSEEPLMEWACRYALFSAQQALDEVLNNLPVRYMGLLLRPVVFPTGRYQKLPDDSLHRKVAAVLQTPGPVRNRLTEDVYQPKDLEAFGTHLETAMELCQESANIEQRLDRIGLMPEPGRRWEQWFQERVDASDISRSEADLLQRTRQAVLRVFNIGDRASNEGPDGGQ